MSALVFTNRFEIKYLVKTSHVPWIKDRLSGLLIPDPHNQDQTGYYNHSIYFDTPRYRFYNQKNEGLEFRVKPRLRVYRATLDGKALKMFLEFKEKRNRIVHKHRTEVSPELAEQLLSSQKSDDFFKQDDHGVLSNFHYLTKQFHIQPAVAVLYHRAAYYSPIYANVRVTFDSGIRGSLAARLDAPRSSLVQVLPPELTMIELKYNDKLPWIFLKEFESLELEQVTFSKYGVTLEVCHAVLARRYRTFP